MSPPPPVYPPPTITIALAFSTLFLGIALYGWLVLIRRAQHRRFDSFYTMAQVSWLIIALFPVIILFSMFPNSDVDGTFLGVSVSGAAGLFALIWWYGTRSARQAGLADRAEALEEQLNELSRISGSQNLASASPVDNPVNEHEKYTYRVAVAPTRHVGFVTGSITSVTDIDCWVNSENTNMQMARFFDRSVSGVIRYAGARKDFAGSVMEDVIADELQQAMGSNLMVQPATVIVTGAGELERTHKVKAVFHVASVHGEVGSGYRSIGNIEDCVGNVLREADNELVGGQKLRSVLFPLLGTGTGGGELSSIVDRLFTTAISYCETNRSGNITHIYFLAWTEMARETCLKVLTRLSNSGRIFREDRVVSG